MNMIKKLFKQREAAIVLIVLGLSIIMTIASSVFLTYQNIVALLLGMSIEVIIAVGMANLMASGGFDMSVGSILAFSGVCAGLVLKAGMPPIVAVVVGVVIGGLVGLFNGFIIAKLEINAFVTTLASLSLFRGLTLIVTRGQNVTGLGDAFNAIGQKVVLGVQAPIWYAIILVIIGDILMRHSRFFRQNYYIGGNEKSAKLSGIKVIKIKILNYVTVGLLAGFAGIVATARMGTGIRAAGHRLGTSRDHSRYHRRGKPARRGRKCFRRISRVTSDGVNHQFPHTSRPGYLLADLRNRCNTADGSFD